MRDSESGFSLVEVVAAMVILTVGVLALAASAASVGRLTAEGSRMAAAANAASSKFEELRANANASSANCQALAGGSDSHPGGFTRTWTTAYDATYDKQTVTIVVSYSNGRQTRSTTYVTEMSCV